VINAGWDVEGFAPDDIPSAMDKMLDRLARASRAQQITAGGVSGWSLSLSNFNFVRSWFFIKILEHFFEYFRITGFLFNKFGKPVLYLAGGTLIIALVCLYSELDIPKTDGHILKICIFFDCFCNFLVFYDFFCEEVIVKKYRKNIIGLFDYLVIILFSVQSVLCSFSLICRENVEIIQINDHGSFQLFE
jgi:hypothetical protein